jgi:hypothetical protein
MCDSSVVAVVVVLSLATSLISFSGISRLRSMLLPPSLPPSPHVFNPWLGEDFAVLSFGGFVLISSSLVESFALFAHIVGETACLLGVPKRFFLSMSFTRPVPLIDPWFFVFWSCFSGLDAILPVFLGVVLSGISIEK